MDAKHTPGPWEVSKDEGDVVVVSEDLPFIATVHTSALKGTQKANARLIAAAPELLEALKHAEKWMEGWASADPYIGYIRAAIAKAEGKQ